MSHIASDNWRNYLTNTNKADTKAIFGFLARAEGRKQKGFSRIDMHPMTNTEGVRVNSPQEKVALLTQAFKVRFTAEETSDAAAPTDGLF